VPGMSADTILARIDDTLAGCDGAVSVAGTDAMRWAPERVICDGGKPLRIQSRRPASALLAGFSDEQMRETLALVGRQITAAFAVLAQSLRAAMPALLKIAHVVNHQRRHVRCRACNPAGNPLPLAINGHEYHRRQLARRRRRR